jgi:hypothetical protein
MRLHSPQCLLRPQPYVAGLSSPRATTSHLWPPPATTNKIWLRISPPAATGERKLSAIVLRHWLVRHRAQSESQQLTRSVCYLTNHPNTQAIRDSCHLKYSAERCFALLGSRPFQSHLHPFLALLPIVRPLCCPVQQLEPALPLNLRAAFHNLIHNFRARSIEERI